MSDPRGWDKHKDAIEAAKKELLAELGLLGDKVTLDKIYALMGQGMTAQCVKSVQFQKKGFSGNSGSCTHTFSISEVDVNKIFIYVSTSGSTSECVSNIESYTSTSVTIRQRRPNDSHIGHTSIFVIEFY